MRADALRILLLSHGLASPSTLFGDTLAYRGTSSMRDLLYDADVRTGRFHGLTVHRGFLHMYYAHRRECATQPRLIGGYSCGGVLAVLHAVDMAVDGCPVPRVCTVGAPRFLAEESTPLFEELMRDTRITRVRNVRDIITDLPGHLCHPSDEETTLDFAKHGNPLAAHSSVNYARWA